MAIDPRQNGVSPISGLRYDPNSTAEGRYMQDAAWQQMLNERKKIKHGVNTSFNPDPSSFVESQHYAPGTPGYERGMSKYDDDSDALTPVTSFDDLQQRRYEAQPWWDSAANGVAKFLGRAATSFVDGVLGPIAGIGSFAINGAAGNGWDVSNLWDNPFTNAMADIDDWFNENFVNYQSLKQKQNSENGEWWKNMDSMNLWMDDVLTNVGFTVGMIGSAVVTGGLGGAAVRGLRGVTAGAARSAARQGNNLLRNTFYAVNKATNNIGQPVTKFLTIANSSMGEAALEGLSTKREMMQEETQRINATIDQNIMADPQVQQLESEYQQQTALLDQQFGYDRSNPMYQQYKQQLDAQYKQQRGQLTAQYENQRQAAMQQLEENATKAGDAVVGMNLAILIPSNFNLAGRFIDKAYRSAERSAGRAWAVRNGEIGMKNALGQRNITGNAAEGYGSRSFLGNYAKRMGSVAFSEGIYEEMGQGAASKGAKKYHEYADADNYWRARLDPDSVDLVADGSHDFLSALGYGIKETYGSADGWKEGFIGGITGMLFGGSEMRDEWRDTRFAKRAAKDLNNQLKSDKLPNLLQHLVAQSVHEQNKIRLAEEGNQNDWKTEDDKAMFSLISSFARAGRMDDLYAMIDEHSRNMSDEEVQSIINGAVKEVTPEMQRKEMRDRINETIDKKIASHLKEGADNEAALRSDVEQATLNEQQVRQQVAGVLGEKAVDKRKTNDLRRLARTARNSEVKHAAQTLVEAIDARKQAQEKYDLAMKSPESKDAIAALEQERTRLLSNADNSSPDTYWEGPSGLVDNNGNVADVNAARDHIKHNTDRIRQAVQNYQDAVEEINRSTRGILSKDQEDYLACIKYLSKTHLDRAEELVRKWRDILPESFTMTIPKGSAKKIAERFGLPENAIQEDPNEENQATVSTKDMTDEQFGNFMLYGLMRHDYLHWKNQEGDVDEEFTKNMRQQLSDNALKAVEDEVSRSGKRRDFNRDDFIRDMTDAGASYEKSNAFAEAFMEAMENPGNIYSAKDRAMRWLKDKWKKTRDTLAQKKKSIDDIIAEGDEAIANSTPYQQMQILAKRVRDRVERFYDEKLEKVFKDIEDLALRTELVEKTKAYIKDLLQTKTGSEEPTVLDVDAVEEVGDILAYMRLKDIDEDGSIAAETTEEQRRLIDKALKAFGKNSKSFLKGLNAAINAVHEKMNELIDAGKKVAKDISESTPYKTVVSYARNLLSKFVNSPETYKRLRQLEDVLQRKLDTLEGDKTPLAKEQRSMYKALLKQIKALLASFANRKQPDNAQSDEEQQSAVEQPSAEEEQQPEHGTPVAGTEETAHEQNPSEEEEEEAMMRYMDIAEPKDVLNKNIWQTTTGEFARRSNFTYQTYADIIDRYLKKWDEEHKDVPEAERSAQENTKLHIPEFDPHGSWNTVAQWRKLERRSRIIHERLKDSFGYIDSGQVRAGQQVDFLITKDDTVGTIVYIVHNGKVIGDLNHPDYGATDSSGALRRMYQIFDEEYGKGEVNSKLGGVVSKYHTTVANVFAGFPRYKEGAKKGTATESTVAEISGNEPIKFYIIGSQKASTQDDVVASGAVGQPCILVARPGNEGLTRWRAVPVKTRSITETRSAKYGKDLVQRVLQQAARNIKSNEELIKFLKHFLNCESVLIETKDGDDDTFFINGEQHVKKAKKFNVFLRQKNGKGQSIISQISFAEDGTGINISGDLRCNVSAELLSNKNLYAKAVEGGTNLPETYDDFLKEVCFTKLADTKTHNSWITINKLTEAADGSLVEVQDAPVEQQGNIHVVGKDTVSIHDAINNETIRVAFTLNSFGVPSVKSITHAKGTNSFTGLKLTPQNYQRVLRLIATASMYRGGAKWGQRNYVEFNGVVYEFIPEKSNVGSIRISDNPSVQYTKRSIDEALPSLLAAVLRHYNGKNINYIIDEFFGKDAVKGKLKKSLEHLLNDVKAGKQVIDGVSFEDKVQLLNKLRDQGIDREQERRQLYNKLAKRLAKHGIKINQITEDGQRIVDEAARRLQSSGRRYMQDYENESGVNFFLSKDGTIVYGFYDPASDTIYVDPDLVTPNALIHEYTHMWTRVLRSTKEGKAIWADIVKDLKKNEKLWQEIIDTYGDFVKKRDEHGNMVPDDDKVADEVFAHLSGSEGEAFIKKHIDDPAGTVTEKIKALFKKILDFIKSLFGVGSYAKTMRELVWWDMLSENPLDNFDFIEQKAEPSPAPVEPSKEEGPAATTTQIPLAALGSMKQALIIRKLKQLGVPDSAISGGMVTLDSSITDAMLVGVGLKPRPKNIMPYISISSQEPVGGVSKTVADNMSLAFRSDSSFDGIAKHIDDLEQGIARHHLSFDQFMLAANIILTSEQRQKLWDGVSDIQASVPDSNAELAASVVHHFRIFMSEGTVGNKQADSVYETLLSGINALVSNKESVSDVEKALMAVPSTESQDSPSDPLYTLTKEERQAAKHQYLDTLTEGDVTWLEMAGYTEDTYHRLLDESKEKIRRCVL